MQAVSEKKQTIENPHIPSPLLRENWLFICCRCGQPIRYDEPLQVDRSLGGEVIVAHQECPLASVHSG